MTRTAALLALLLAGCAHQVKPPQRNITCYHYGKQYICVSGKPPITERVAHHGCWRYDQDDVRDTCVYYINKEFEAVPR